MIVGAHDTNVARLANDEMEDFGFSHASIELSGKKFNLRATLMTKTTNTKMQTPAELGYSMPAEWEPHEATWLGWPHNPTDWPDKLDTIRWVYGEIVRRIAPSEIVKILVNSKAVEKLASRYLKRAGA